MNKQKFKDAHDLYQKIADENKIDRKLAKAAAFPFLYGPMRSYTPEEIRSSLKQYFGIKGDSDDQTDSN